MKIDYIPMNLSRSDVLNTFTGFCPLSSESFDHIEQLYFSASAKYCTSSESGEILFASSKDSKKSSFGTILISATVISSSNNCHNTSLLTDAFSDNSSRCSVISSTTNSGAIKDSLPDKINALVVESFSNAANNTLASTTSCTYIISRYRLATALFTFLPNFIASSSVSLLLDNILFIFSRSSTLSRIDCLATSDQFISGNSSIFFFSSSGTDKVIFGISPPHIYYVYYVQILKACVRVNPCASVHNLDIVVSENRRSMCSDFALNSYDICNSISDKKAPNFVRYEKFKSMVSVKK